MELVPVNDHEDFKVHGVHGGPKQEVPEGEYSSRTDISVVVTDWLRSIRIELFAIVVLVFMTLWQLWEGELTYALACLVMLVGLRVSLQLSDILTELRKR